jgi:integrase
MQDQRMPTGALVIAVMKDGTPVYEAKWRYGGRQVKRRLGKAWVTRSLGGVWKEQDKESPWRKRRGRPPAGYLDARAAAQRMAEVIREHADETTNAEAMEAERRAKAALSVVTVADAADAWLHWAQHVKGMRPSTLADYRYCLRGRILNDPRFAQRSIAEVRAPDVRAWRDELLEAGASPRTANKLRQLLSNVFTYAARTDTYALPANPVLAVEKVKEGRPGRVNYFSPEESAALIRAAAAGAHRKDRTPAGGRHGRPEEEDARQREDEQDAALFTVASFAGLRKGELLALRWRDVDFAARKVQVWASYTAGQEGATKSEEPRSVPMVDQVARCLARLSQRPHFTAPDDLVFCNRTGQFLDGSALRRRYVAARDAAELRPLRFHDLRHSFASMASRAFAPHEVQAFLGHADARTTRRYVHFRPEPDHAERLTRVFDVLPVEDERTAIAAGSPAA